jgi:hypothetical protein
MKSFCLFLLLALSMASCSKYEPLLLSRTPYQGNELRTNGFWYHVRYSQFEEEPSMNLYFLYRDGTFLRATTVHVTDPSKVTMDSISHQGHDDFNRQTAWGVFQVEDSVLKWSKWYWQSLGSGHAYLTTLKILNDTCFKKEEVEEYYYFYPFDYKPDSTIARQWIP